MHKLVKLPLAALALALAAPAMAKEEPLPPEIEKALKVADSLHPKQGKIALPTAHATLDLGKSYDFYDAEDARKIIVDIWGNPPEAGDGILGLVMPAGKSPVSDSWGAVLSYEPTGYVEDSDAADADFGAILEELKTNAEAQNEARKSQGYPGMHVAGWAESPRYDAGTHSVVWARDLMIDGNQVHTLNYDLRTLGRSGVLSVNFIAGMPDLPAIKTAAADFARHASFDTGSRYADFDPSLDEKAEYGIGGLVAAGVGVAAAKKLGLLAILLKFLKPIAIAVVAGGAAIARFGRNLFGRGGGEA